MDELNRLAPEEIKSADRHPIIVILDDVRSMHNVGSVFRTCDAFAVQELLLCGYTPTPPHRDIHKTALGATETVHWQHFTSPNEAIVYARNLGFEIWCVEQVHNSVPLNELVWQGTKIALVFGNEVTGVAEDIISIADKCVEIPQWGSKHSLNISVSAGVTLWELVRQKK